LLFLSGEEVQSLLPMEEAIDVIEEALRKYAAQDYIMPVRTFCTVKDEDTFLIMPCVVDGCIGLKVATSYPSNQSRQSPVTQAIVLVHDRETGDPLAVINGTVLTAIKTAAVSGVVLRYFGKDAETVGLVGTGLQGLYQLLAALSATSVRKIYLHNRTPEKIEGFIRDFRRLSGSGVETVTAADARELVRHSDIIITATTSLTPVLPDEVDLYGDKLVIGIGSYKSNMREFPEALFKAAKYFVIDSEHGKRECGDIIDPLLYGWVRSEQVLMLSDLIAEKKESEGIRKARPIVFKSVSMALFDACMGNYVYQKARLLGRGTVMDF